MYVGSLWKGTKAFSSLLYYQQLFINETWLKMVHSIPRILYNTTNVSQWSYFTHKRIKIYYPNKVTWLNFIQYCTTIDRLYKYHNWNCAQN